ncbi:hypothetical protein F2Q69_00011739 [Brassica cretica]|uniref:Uncharacterized protein n=1 Tax=Brassica cretica TaxID=69181 RepID=A0A8S9R751_BRACR|nr:hypothetical protein F2Q69_00011739 [Brassica cretica]
MAESLQDAIRSMSLKDDDPIDLPDNPCFQVFEQNALSILGLNTVIARGQQELGVCLSVPPGFEPLFPELPPEERAMAMQYIAHSDPTERQARIVRVQQSILTEGVPERVDMSNAIK